MTLAKQLKISRKNKGFSQSEVAEILNITRQSVSKWETGKGYPDIDNLVLLSKIYEVSIDELLHENEILKKKTNENNTIVERNKHKLEEIQTTTKADMEKKDDSILLLILSIVSCLIPFLGLVIPILILKSNKKTNKHYHLIKVICLCCFIVSGFNTFIFLNDTIFHIGEKLIQLIK